MGGAFDKKPGGGTLLTQTSGGDGGGPGKHTLTEQLGDGTPGASHEPWHGPMRVTTNGLNVRSSPAKHGRDNIIGVLHHHAQIEARGREGEWVKTDHRSKSAFVFGGYLAPVGKPAGAAHAKAPAATPAAPKPAEPHHDAPAATVHADDPEHVSPVPPTAPADAAHDAAKPKEAEKAAATPGTTTTPKPPAPAESPPPATGTGHPPLPLDHLGKFVYEVHVGSATQKVLVFVSAGQLTLTPDVFMFFHGQWANYGIDPRQLAERKAAEQARIAKDKADPSKDPKKVRGDETEGYVESGRNSAEEAMQHAQNRNVISILPQGVMGGGGSTGGHMGTLTAKGGGLPALIDAVMTALQKDLHGDKLKPGRISIAGHSAGGYMGIHEALANAGDMKDTITDVTLMDAEYNGSQFANASSWLLQGKPGKSFRIVASGKQLKTGLHLDYFSPENLKAHAEAKGFTVADKGGVGQPRGPETTVVYHAQIMKGAEVHGDVLILNTAMGHHQVRDNVMDDSILNIGKGAAGGGDSFGTALHGVPAAEGAGKGTPTPTPTSTTTSAPVHDHSAPKPAPGLESPKAAPADAKPTSLSSAGEVADEAPQHNADPAQPETPRAPPPKIKVPSNSASKDLYAPGGVLHVSHLTRGKHNSLDDAEFAFKQEVYLAATEARMTQKIFGGLADEELEDIRGYPMPEQRKFRKILMPALYDLLSAMERDIKAGVVVKGKSPSDVKGVGISSGYRGPKEEIGLWDSYFQKYLAATTAARAATGDPFGKDAVKLMVKYIGKRKAAPGHSNHSNGTAVDIWAISKTHKIPNEFGNQGPWYDSWHYAWLKENAAGHNFRNYDAEAWHWEYNT